uniref:C-type lectin domain-containing protein n=1 Tax=Pygocentrus nattereri TaxID=42514 RepID=A0A3B4DGW6_PYGNA
MFFLCIMLMFCTTLNLLHSCKLIYFLYVFYFFHEFICIRILGHLLCCKILCVQNNERNCCSWFSERSSSYVFINDFKSWHDAQSYCRKNHTDLASVRNQAENVKIKEAAKGKTVWIGLFRVFWKWSDQSYSSFWNWKQKQADISSGKETCGYIVMTDGGYWSNENCETKFPFICYEKLNELTKPDPRSVFLH